MKLTRTEFSIAFIIPIYSVFLGSIFSVITADPEKHWDIYNYYDGFLNIYLNKDVFSYIYFGQGIEFLLNSLYYITSFFWWPSRPYSLIIFNSFLFYFIFLISGVVYSLYLRGYYEKENIKIDKNMIFVACISSIYSFIPLGITLQLARQTITFSIILLIATILHRLVTNKNIITFALFISIAISHTGSLLLSFIFNEKPIRNSIYLITLSILIGNLYVVLFPASNSISNIFSIIETDVFSNIYMNGIGAILIIALLTSGSSLNFRDYIIIITIILYTTLPYLFLSRIFYGIEWVLLPLYTIDSLGMKLKKGRNGLRIIIFSAFFFLLFKSIYIIYIIW